VEKLGFSSPPPQLLPTAYNNIIIIFHPTTTAKAKATWKNDNHSLNKKATGTGKTWKIKENFSIYFVRRNQINILQHSIVSFLFMLHSHTQTHIHKAAQLSR